MHNNNLKANIDRNTDNINKILAKVSVIIREKVLNIIFTRKFYISNPW